MNRRSDAARRLESSYPFVHELRSQFRDLDPLGHVNNVVVSAYYEDARVTFMTSFDFGIRRDEDRRAFMLIANVDIDYLGEALHPRLFRIGIGISRIGSSSITLSAALFQDGNCIGLCDATSVFMTPDGPTPLSERQRGLLAQRLVGFAQPAPVG